MMDRLLAVVVVVKDDQSRLCMIHDCSVKKGENRAHALSTVDNAR